MRKLFMIVFVFAIVLLLQDFAESSSVISSVNSLGGVNEESDIDGALTAAKKHHPRPRRINCNYACSRRCMKSSRKKVCHRACKTCCLRCNCVPPGTYGNRNACPCYASLKTHGHKPKCP